MGTYMQIKTSSGVPCLNQRPNLRPEYTVSTKSKPLLQMPLPTGHQQTWYWICTTNILTSLCEYQQLTPLLFRGMMWNVNIYIYIYIYIYIHFLRLNAPRFHFYRFGMKSRSVPVSFGHIRLKLRLQGNICLFYHSHFWKQPQYVAIFYVDVYYLHVSFSA